MRLPHAPEELTTGCLRRLGEGVGKVVYASEHWVVKRERTVNEIIALIVLWKLVRKLERIIPGMLGKRLVEKPSRQIRFLRVLMQGIVSVIPWGVWRVTHVGEVLRTYRLRDRRGERLAKTHLTGTELMPERIVFAPIRVEVGGWPGWLTVGEAAERVECTLNERLAQLAAANKMDELEVWLERFLKLRQAGWRRGLFSVDAHLKNFGVCGKRVVLLDAGGLTDNLAEVEDRLAREEDLEPPHIRLGLAPLLETRPDIAERFDARWRATVNPECVRQNWPDAEPLQSLPSQTRSNSSSTPKNASSNG